MVWRVRHAQELSVANRYTFITPDLWLSNSPNLSPIDYKIWDIIQQRVYQTEVQDVNDSGQRLIDAWADVERSVTDQCRRCLHACIRARGVYFEYSLWHTLVETCNSFS